MSVGERFQQEFGQTIREAAAEADRLLERQRAVGDAIVLERAARVLRRRSPEGLKYDVTWLEHYARTLRQEAESGA